MKKENIEVVQYSKEDSDYEFLLELHKLIFIDGNLEDVLIYFDPSFKNYFKKVLQDSSNFVAVIKVEGCMAGFVHYKFIGDVLFLNNICISAMYQGKGLGSYLLRESLKLIVPTFDYLELDVFSNNANAITWYSKLGLSVSNKSKWYKWSRWDKVEVASSFIEKNDDNGFCSVYDDNRKIGTIVNQNLIVHDYNLLGKILKHCYYNIFINSDKFIEFERQGFTIIEESMRMRGDLNTIKTRINY